MQISHRYFGNWLKIFIYELSANLLFGKSNMTFVLVVRIYLVLNESTTKREAGLKRRYFDC
jgi:hypothetical protein